MGMYKLSYGSTLLLFTTSIWAAPTSPPDLSSFKLNRLATGAYSSITPNIAIYNTYRKHGWNISDELSQAALADLDKIAQPDFTAGPPAQNKVVNSGHGTVIGNVKVVPDQYATEYLAEVQIGGQTLKLDLDTGSSDL